MAALSSLIILLAFFFLSVLTVQLHLTLSLKLFVFFVTAAAEHSNQIKCRVY